MKQERITNPSSVERAVIESKIAEGYLVILQFDKPPYSPELLKRINNLCGEFGEKLEVRFYGHYGTHFDASVLRSLPDVAALSIDCLFDVTNLAALNELANLRCLSLGIYNLDDSQILESLQLQNLKKLSIGESLKVNFDLAPLQASHSLTNLYVEKHTKNIDSLATLPALHDLTLRCISKKQGIGFVSKIQSLRRLVVILGGRTDISEVIHPSLEELEIIRVMGFTNFDSIVGFPSLRSLKIEDQIRLEKLLFTELNGKIKSVRIWNCKKLKILKGLEHLNELQSLWIGQTELEVDEILQQRLSPSLKEFAFGSNTRKKSEEISKKLAALGYLRRCR